MNGGPVRHSAAVGEKETENDGKEREDIDGGASLALGAALAHSPAFGNFSTGDDVGNNPPSAIANGIEEKFPLEAATPGIPAGEVKEEQEDEKEVEYFCGIGPWHPARLQRLRDARVFTFLLCLFSAAEGALVSGERFTLHHNYLLSFISNIFRFYVKSEFHKLQVYLVEHALL